MKTRGMYISKFDICHTHILQQYKENTQTTFASPSKNAVEKKERLESKNYKENFVESIVH